MRLFRINFPTFLFSAFIILKSGGKFFLFGIGFYSCELVQSKTRRNRPKRQFFSSSEFLHDSAPNDKLFQNGFRLYINFDILKAKLT